MVTKGHARRLVLLAIAFSAGVLASGCATNRGVLDVRPAIAPNPPDGVAVKLTEVVDRRVFELRPRNPSTPSLKDGQIENRSLTSRAIARKRNSYGRALGDILLPEGRTVEQVGREVVTRGLRDSGYRVLAEEEPGFPDAVPLRVDIEKFWSWFTPGFWVVHLEFDASIRVTGPLEPFTNGVEFRGYARRGAWASTGGIWLDTMQRGMTALDQDMQGKLREAAAARPVETGMQEAH